MKWISLLIFVLLTPVFADSNKDRISKLAAENIIREATECNAFFSLYKAYIEEVADSQEDEELAADLKLYAHNMGTTVLTFSEVVGQTNEEATALFYERKEIFTDQQLEIIDQHDHDKLLNTTGKRCLKIIDDEQLFIRNWLDKASETINQKE